MKLKNLRCVYFIRCRSKNRIYIGATTDYSARIGHHLFELRHGIHCVESLQNDFSLLGIEEFDWGVIETCPEEKKSLRLTEAYWSEILRNVCYGKNRVARDPILDGRDIKSALPISDAIAQMNVFVSEKESRQNDRLTRRENRTFNRDVAKEDRQIIREKFRKKYHD